MRSVQFFHNGSKVERKFLLNISSEYILSLFREEDINENCIKRKLFGINLNFLLQKLKLMIKLGKNNP